MEYTASVTWKRNTPDFSPKSYDRTHQVQFGGNTTIDASSAPEFLGNKDLPNPEELFTGSIASCFMLTFLYLAATKGLTIDEYHAEAVGTLSKDVEGKMAVTAVAIKPTILFAGQTPDATLLNELFDKAHQNCFISSSVKSTITIAHSTATA